MTVTKNLKTGKWDCAFWYKDWQGVRKHTTKRGFDKKRDAEKYESDMRNKTHTHDPKFSEVIAAYQQELDSKLKLGELKQSTVDKKNQALKYYVLPFFENMNVDKVTPLQVMRWLAIQNEKSKKERLSSRLLNQIRSELSQVFEFSKRNCGTKNNPVTLTDRVKPYSNDTRAKLWTVEQYKIFYDDIKIASHRVLFNIIFWAGLRIGEVMALKIEDILPYKIHVNKSLMRIHNKDEFVISTPKTRSSVRDVEIPKYLYNQIIDYIGTLYKAKPEDYIFDGIKPSAIRTYMQYHCTKLGLPRISPHILRHSYASMLYAATGDILAVAKQIGHADKNTTFEFYAHMMPEANRKAVDKLESLTVDNSTKNSEF